MNFNVNTSAQGAAILAVGTEPDAVTWIRVNADNTVTYRSAAETLSDIGAQASLGSFGGVDTVLYTTAASTLASSANFTFNGATNSFNAGASDAYVNVDGALKEVLISASSGADNGFCLVSGIDASLAFTDGVNSWGVAASASGLILAAGTTQYLIPDTDGTSGQVLQTDGAGTLSWASASAGITIDDTSITGGTATSLLYHNSSNQVSEISTYMIRSLGTDIWLGSGWTSSPSSSLNNTSLGYLAGKVITNGNNNTLLGYNAGASVAGGDKNTLIGSGAGSATTGNNCVCIGYSTNLAAGVDNTIAIGSAAGLNMTAGVDYGIYIGSSAGASSAYASCIAIGNSASGFTATHQGILGSNNSNGYISNWYFNGVTHSAPYSVVLNASGGSGTNIAGASMTISAGKGTGTGTPGDKKTQTSVPTISGTTLQTLGDRVFVQGKYVTLTNTVATSVIRINVPTGTVAGGEIIFTIEANDGTDFQCYTDEARYSISNKAGTLTMDISVAPGSTNTTAASTGTLTATITQVDSGSGNCDFKITATSSLTTTVLRANCHVIKNFGAGSISSL